MERVATWLKPGGWVYADVPYGPAYQVHGTEYRVYDESALRARLVPAGLTLARTWYAAWRDYTLRDTPPTDHRGMAYVALLARKD